jgi:hypothetical protein
MVIHYTVNMYVYSCRIIRIIYFLSQSFFFFQYYCGHYTYFFSESLYFPDPYMQNCPDKFLFLRNCCVICILLYVINLTIIKVIVIIVFAPTLLVVTNYFFSFYKTFFILSRSITFLTSLLLLFRLQEIPNALYFSCYLYCMSSAE